MDERNNSTTITIIKVEYNNHHQKPIQQKANNHIHLAPSYFKDKY